MKKILNLNHEITLAAQHTFINYWAKCLFPCRKLKAYIDLCKKLPTLSLPLASDNRSIDISIIIPVFNQWEYTTACINSIIKTYDHRLSIEIILADDNSTDKTRQAHEVYPGLIINKTPSTVGFLKNCNASAKKARGRYIFLLNNDTLVMPNTLYPLYETLEHQPDCAIVGPKILNSNGTIQEAGAIVLKTGKVRRIGEGFNRFTPQFNLMRKTHYISGCSLLIRRSFWEATGGFDERYKTAYFEDTDLATTAHAMGHQVIYQPSSEIIHFSSKSYQKNKRALCQKNKDIFLKKWAGTLTVI